ncbi:DNA cytosine methyltransferase [Bulleidia sp. HCP3S3_G12]|uniref:DNA cytosine methyltransferase n=1 Tax=Bulleidia sp. HCP3S3_G12 TaxID=3438916 RepID=UPI003F8A3BB0
MTKIKFIDLFAGCGGLFDGFMQSGFYEPVASVEWEKAPVEVLRNRLKMKYHIDNTDEVIRFDIQREDELFNGFDDNEYGKNPGLDKMVNEHNGIDIVIGGPPCQAYSVAGRNAGRMKGDYRNYLFEHYISVINRYQPKLFVFENVPGMLSAMPDGTLITDLIKRDLSKIGYEIINDIRDHALIDTSEFGVPQSRKRVILIGIKSELLKDPQLTLKKFYTAILPKYKSKKIYTLEDAIGDLPKIVPVKPYKKDGKNVSHEVVGESKVSWHVPRYQNQRDIEVFKKLCKDIENGDNKYSSTDSLIKLYEETTGKKTSVHKYHVLRKEEPSTTILAHLYKDGFRFIHYDSEQARTITVREAARIQTFQDDFEFPCTMGAAYKMIGNAVPSLFAKKLSEAVHELYFSELGGK